MLYKLVLLCPFNLAIVHKLVFESRESAMKFTKKRPELREFKIMSEKEVSKVTAKYEVVEIPFREERVK
jgi:hypothetical protein